MDFVSVNIDFSPVPPLARGRILDRLLNCFGAQFPHPGNFLHFNFFHVLLLDFCFTEFYHKPHALPILETVPDFTHVPCFVVLVARMGSVGEVRENLHHPDWSPSRPHRERAGAFHGEVSPHCGEDSGPPGRGCLA